MASLISRILGRTLKVRATEFDSRTIVRQQVSSAIADRSLIEIASARFQGGTVPDGQRFAGLPPVRRDAGTVAGDDLNQRYVGNDPREMYWGVLPNKIQPKQAQFMLRAALGGDLWQQWRLYSVMADTWPKFAMAFHQLREAVAYTKFSVTAFADEGQQTSDLALEKRDLVSRALRSMTPNPFCDERGRSGMIYDFTDAVCSGLTMSELQWQDPRRARGGSWERLPKAATWIHPRHYSFDQTGKVVVWGSDYSLVYDDPRLIGGRIGQSPNPNKFICSQFMSRSGSALACGFMRPLVWWWCARQYGLDFVLKMAQNFGNPTVSLKYKGTMSQAEKVALLNEVIKGMGNRVLMYPEAATLEIEPAQNLGQDNPQRWIVEESDREALYLLLGQTGSTISTPGKLGGEDSHQDVKQERVAGIGRWVGDGPLDQFARAVLRVNYGEDGDTECPSIAPDFTRPLNAQEVGTLCTATSTSQVPLKADEFYSKIGFGKPEDGDTVIQGGQIKLQGKPQTQEEIEEHQIEIQHKQAEVAAPTEASDPLSSASDVDLAELEQLVTAAERAPHRNGEITQVAAKLRSIKRR